MTLFITSTTISAPELEPGEKLKKINIKKILKQQLKSFYQAFMIKTIKDKFNSFKKIGLVKNKTSTHRTHPTY